MTEIEAPLRLHNIRVGDLVQLKSEHCRMTVEKVEGDTIHCVYMTQSLLIARDSFPAICLVKVTYEAYR
jgi:hypothetical protein